MATIAKNRYYPEQQILKIRFGYEPDVVYTYVGVNAEIGNGLESADSKGKFFHANIRDKFQFTKKPKALK
jgi:hypothetical protein